MRFRNPLIMALSGAMLSGGLATAAPAVASPRDMGVHTASIQQPPRAMDPATFQEGLRQFEASSVPRTTVGSGNSRLVTYHFKNGFNLTLPHSQGKSGTPQRGSRVAISGGTNRYGVWIGFNQRDQNILKSAFWTTTLGAAICAIPGVGWAACGLAGFAISVAAGYVIKSGVCSNRRTLYWYSVRGGSTVRCLSSIPR